jgi:hypothetical protein
MLIFAGAALADAAPAENSPLTVSNAFTIRADWFDQGNALSGGTYSDGHVCIFNGGTIPNLAHYRINFPAAGIYEIHGLYAAHQSRPVKIRLDGKLVRQGFDSTSGSWQTSSARWEKQGEIQVHSVGTHTVTLEALDMFPHICALRFQARTALPREWRLHRSVAKEAMTQAKATTDYNNGQAKDWGSNPTGHFGAETDITRLNRSAWQLSVIDASTAASERGRSLGAGDHFSFNNELSYTPEAYRRHTQSSPSDRRSIRMYAKLTSADATQLLALDPAKMHEMLQRIKALIADFRLLDKARPDRCQTELDQCSALKPSAALWSQIFNAPVSDPVSHKTAARAFAEKYLDTIYLYVAVVKQNPLLDFDQLLLRKSTWTGFVPNWYSNCARAKPTCKDELIAVDPAGPLTQAPRLLLAAPRNAFAGD